MPTDPGTPPASRWEAFQHRGFVRYWWLLLLTGFAVQMQTVAIGWQVYDITRDPFDLGLVGLSQFLPALLLVTVTGSAADRWRRRTIIAFCLGIMVLTGIGFVALTIAGNRDSLPIFGLLFVFGAARAFYNPARQAMISNLVPPEVLPKAIASNSSANNMATICGPVVGGLLYGLSPTLAFVSAVALFLASVALALSIPLPAQRLMAKKTSWETLSAGFRYIWKEKIVLGAISLDLFAVLLGGAVALLPVYASDVLNIGPLGLGMLRAAPAVGAILVGLYLMTHPVTNHAGRIMFAAVVVFGVFTLVFALSQTVWISMLALTLMGGADMISVLVRSTLIQLRTPDEVRGRVNAVNQVFIGASNELGAFRAGSMAALLGPVTAVVLGGIGTLAVAGLWYRWFPDLRRVRQL